MKEILVVLRTRTGGAKIGVASLEDLEAVVAAVQYWGTRDSEDHYSQKAFGQFVVTDGAAFFEVVIGE